MRIGNSVGKRPGVQGGRPRQKRPTSLCRSPDVPDFTLEWIEGHGRISGKDLKALAAIQAQLETAGIEFTDDEGIPGLRLHPRERESKGRAASPRRASLT
jgi:hypothetical protein